MFVRMSLVDRYGYCKYSSKENLMKWKDLYNDGLTLCSDMDQLDTENEREEDGSDFFLRIAYNEEFPFMLYHCRLPATRNEDREYFCGPQLSLRIKSITNVGEGVIELEVSTFSTILPPGIRHGTYKVRFGTPNIFSTASEGFPEGMLEDGDVTFEALDEWDSLKEDAELRELEWEEYMKEFLAR